MRYFTYCSGEGARFDRITDARKWCIRMLKKRDMNGPTDYAKITNYDGLVTYEEVTLNRNFLPFTYVHTSLHHGRTYMLESSTGKIMR